MVHAETPLGAERVDPLGGNAAAVAAGQRRAAVGAEAGCRRATVDGVSLAIDDEGSGPAVVCLHAIGHGAGDYARLRARLRSQHRVLALDWPGQGRSTPDAQPPSARRYASLLAGLLDELEVESAVVIGNSIGGAAAIRYAHDHPTRVRGLVLANPGGLAPVDDAAARFALATMARFFAAGERGAFWFPRAFAAYYRLCVLQRPAARAQRLRIAAAAYEIAPILAAAWRSFAAPEADLRGLAPAVECPVLFTWAMRDRFVQLARSLPAIERFPNARVERFDAGHAAQLETPDEFEDSVERFLSEASVAGRIATGARAKGFPFSDLSRTNLGAPQDAERSSSSAKP